MTFAQLLWQARRHAGLTQLQLADRLRVSPATISDLETGRSSPTAEMAMGLADALGQDPDDFCRAGGRLAPDLVAFLLRRPRMVAQIRAAMEKRERKVA